MGTVWPKARPGRGRGGELSWGGGGRGEAPVFRQPQNRPQQHTSTLTPVVCRVPEPDTGGGNPAVGVIRILAVNFRKQC